MRTLIIVVSTIALFFSCGRGAKTIPSSTLEKMLVDISFMDAYREVVRKDLRADTTSIFEPIFNKYGYTPEDLDYTMRQLISRNSNALNAIVEDAVAQVEESRKVVKWRNDLNQEWQDSSVNYYKEEIYRNPDSIYFGDLKDIDKLKYRFDVSKPGKYTLSLRYKIDEKDENNIRYLKMSILDSTTQKIENFKSAWLNKSNSEWKEFENSIEVLTNSDTRNQLLVELITYGSNTKYAKEPSTHFDSLLIEYYPTKKVAAKRYMDYKVGIDTLIAMFEEYKEARTPKFSSDWLEADYFASLIADSIYRDSIKLDSIRLDSIRVDSIKLDSIRLDSIRLDSIKNNK